MLEITLPACQVHNDRWEHNAKICSFTHDDATVTIRVIFNDIQSGADLAITKS